MNSSRRFGPEQATPFPRSFGALLRHHRILAGLTQEALAERAGLSARAISDLERGVNRTPQLGTLDLLAEVLQLSREERAHFEALARRARLAPRPASPAGIPGPLPEPTQVPPVPETFSSAEATSASVVPDASSGAALAERTGNRRLALQPHPQRSQLPTPPTPLIGRVQEVAAVCALLQRPEVRLLTLMGTAGVGKTRLALQVAATLSKRFAAGVQFISLAALSDPDLVLPTIAQALGLRKRPDQTFLTLLADALRAQSVLLVLDNFEQIIAAATHLSALLETCPQVKLLVTSREVLHLRAERQFPVPPLALPAHHALDDTALEENPSIQLFLHQAQAAQPAFQMTAGNAPLIAEICRQLEGIPLALELAAPRLKLLSPQALLARLEGRLHVLTGGARDLPERQRTMRATIAWSYELLSPAERALFRRLSVFVNGWTLEAAEQVCQAAGTLDLDVLEGLESLLDKSLVRQEYNSDRELRFRLLYVLREFGLDQLAEAGELAETCAAHATSFLELAEQAEPHLLVAEQKVWMDRLEQDHDNLRAALRWSLEYARKGGTEQQTSEGWEIASRLAGALSWFWIARGHFSVWHSFLEQALAAPAGVAVEARAKVLAHAAARRDFNSTDLARSEHLIAESIKLYRELVRRSPEGRTPVQGLVASLNVAGHIALLKGDYPALEGVCEESLALCRQAGERWREAEALYLVALGYSRCGEEARGRATCEEGLAICRELGEGGGTSTTLLSLGCFALRQEDYAGAQQYFEESLAISQQSAIPIVSAPCLVWLGIALAARDQPTRAARLWGAAEGLSETLGLSVVDLFEIPAQREIEPAARGYYARAETRVRAHLGEAAFAAAWTEGRRLSLEAALTAPDQPLPEPRLPSRPTVGMGFARPHYPAGLTAREVEVLRQVAAGLTDQEVAKQLIIAPRTVNTHLTSIYTKLGVTNRVDATRFAVEHHLV